MSCLSTHPARRRYLRRARKRRNYQYKLLRETISDGTTTKTLDFNYDNVGMPYSLIYNNGTTTATYYYITNLQVDVMYLVDANGVQVAAYDYDPYGKVITSTGDLAEINPLRYRGYYYDSETGFYYLQSRYYDPEICRFINADSYASTGDGFTGLNMFAYCNNNPANRIDPDGHDSYVWEWLTTMWWLCLVDGPYPIADAIYVVGAVGILVIDHVITSSNSQRAMLEVEEYIANTDAKSTILESKESKDTKKKKKTTKKSGKEKASDKLSWVDVSQVDFSKTAQQNAARLLDEKWGKGNWSKGPGSDFSKIVKWIQRSLFAYMVQKGIRQTLEDR